jgi:hypothetical protein
MTNFRFYAAGESASLQYAIESLTRHGYTFLPCPDDTVTHLLLPVPSFDENGKLKGGGDVDALLSRLPKSVAIVGGNLPVDRFKDYKCMDLLKDPMYLASNASITAYCAVRLAMMELPVILRGCPTLIIGWGRIGRCLAALL